ncbi:hypothetical protein PT7_1367 [Pusillimonas sp. T7-7]|uniref:hypothetical protein n=1 Tax=Pusillimonas sp. (strain T7-7) TaxID=1007105 RepID=UPI000208488D|nr:hypothetical protein [Pusillimonas sp. T7-7]AEC19907.1 hypothetical protein PT7_1367 [Pusillimonas sp. T7-7]
MATVDEKAKDSIQEGADAVDDKIMAVAEKASDVTRRARGAAIQTVDDGREAIENALACGKAVVRSNPIATVAIVATLAYLCGRMKR